MKHVEATELVSAIPVQMTRREKLLRWAELIRNHGRILQLYSNLEYVPLWELKGSIVYATDATALGVAVADPEFNAQGLASPSNIHDVLKFFEITTDEAHAFSCNCGGYIDNARQADEIESLADR